MVSGFLKFFPTVETIKSLISISIPSGIQQFFFAASLTAMYWVIGKIGTMELAASIVLVNVMMIGILPGLGFGISATTLVSQALGRKDIQDAKKWGWDVAKTTCVALLVLGIPMWAIPNEISMIFISDLDTLKLIRYPMQMMGFYVALEGLNRVLMDSQLGAGNSKTVMLYSFVTQWVIFLPSAYLLGYKLGYGLMAVWISMFISRLFSASIFIRLWSGEKWAKIKL